MSDTAYDGGQAPPERLYNYAAELLNIGKSRREIEAELVASGVDRATASSMITELLDADWQAEGGGAGLGVGARHMLMGLLIAALGIAATFGSYYFAEQAGFVVITYGAVFAGAIDFVYGLLRFLGGD